ncbi:S8 family serine peptidase [Arthrobacter sp. GCM10027362]|uniref:S8 family serine peptidase n=1 Tax=Arthrobacter sp. GCM10027362 TaxID=3273379 RepID=UPI003642A898
MSGPFRRRFAAAASAVSAALLLGALLPVSPAAAAEDLPEAPAQQAVPDTGTDRFIVKFKDGIKRTSAQRDGAYERAAAVADTTADEVRATGTGARVIETDRRLGEDEAADLVQALESRADVEYAEPDRLMQPTTAPNDPIYPDLWGLGDGYPGMRLSRAWEASTGASTVVAVIDTGITAHSDLDANILPGYDMISDRDMSRDGGGRDSNPRDEGDWCGAYDVSSWHGTHVAGTIAAVANNGKGVTGVAYGAKVVPVRALGACGGWTTDITDGIVWAAGGTVPNVPANPNPADVINMSLGGEGYCSQSEQNAINQAVALGSTVVVAAGNENQPAEYVSPANCENVITVASAGPTGELAPYSNYGDAVDVTAPGGDMNHTDGGIVSTWNTGTTVPGTEGYAWMQGTSMAAPHAAGLAALLISANPGMGPAAVEERMKSTARKAVCAGGCGAGHIDAAAALGVAAQLPAVEPAALAVTGNPLVGETVTASTGTWSPSPVTLTYQWFRDGAPIPGAVKAAYTPTVDDLYLMLTVKVTGTRDGYDPAVATSPPSYPVYPGSLSPSVPVIQGTPMIGETLVADPGAWKSGTSLSYQWFRNDSLVSGATGSTYKLTEDDYGARLLVKVTGSKPGYNSASTNSAETAVVTARALASCVPTVTGATRVGSTLTATAGTWTPGTTLTHQWHRSGTAIPGATGRTYTLAPADLGQKVTVTVTGTLTGHTPATRESAATAAIATGYLTAPVPTIAGTARVAGTLTAKTGTWTSGTSLKYQWYRSGAAISGATGSTYKPTASDAGKILKVRVTGSKAGYATTWKDSKGTAAVAKATLSTSKPKITGTARVGSRLTAKAGTWTSGTTLRYQWYRSGKAIRGATGRTYKAVSADRGDRLQVKVTGSKAGYTTAARTSDGTRKI